MALKEEIKKGIACDSIGDPHSPIGRAACIVAHPGRMALFPFFHWFEKRYLGKYKFARLVFSFDLFLVGLALGLGIVGLIFTFYRPSDFTDKIFFEATVAPREVIAGAPSTLIIRFTNGTGEELRNVRLSVGFPRHFLLQELSSDYGEFKGHVIDLGTLAPNDSGSIRIRGVMFGDVGGKQTFRSIMTFSYGEDDIADQKLDFYTFSPVGSTLSLNLQLPEKVVAFQPLEGTITYKNTGEIDFPEISIKPEWPEGFSYISSNAPFENDAFQLPAIAAGEEGVMTFKGELQEVFDEVVFIFHPSFTFGETNYKQESLIEAVPVMPPPIRVAHSMKTETLRPGSTVEVTVSYENISDEPVFDAKIGFTSDSVFFRSDEYTVDASEYPELAKIEPGELGEIIITAPLRSSIQQSETTEYENIQIKTRAIASYLLGSGSGQSIKSQGDEISSTLTSPIILDSFGRYATPTGDQLGRGPLPPIVGVETRYWIFWNIRGTTNPIENVHIEGRLPSNVRFTGKQTVSQNGGVMYDPSTNIISWNDSRIEPTLAPGSKIIGVAFEVAITPTENQVGTSPILMSDIRVTGTDATTGAFVSSSGANVTTNLPSDPMAGGKGIVVSF